MKNELQEFKEGSMAKIHIDSLWATLKKYQIRKHQAKTAYVDSGLKDSLPSTKDWLSKWIDAY